MLPGGQILCPADMQDDSYVFSIKGPLLGLCGYNMSGHRAIKNILGHWPVLKNKN